MKKALLLIFVTALLVFPTTAVRSERFINIREGDYFYHRVYVTSLYRNETWLLEYNWTIQELHKEYIRFRGMEYRNGQLRRNNLTVVYNFSCPELTMIFVPLFVYSRYRNVSRGRFINRYSEGEQSEVIYKFMIKILVIVHEKYYIIRGRSFYLGNDTKNKLIAWANNTFEYYISKTVSYLILAGKFITNYGLYFYDTEPKPCTVLNDTKINDITLVSTSAGAEQKSNGTAEDGTEIPGFPLFEPNLFITALLCIAVVISAGTLILWRKRKNVEEV